MVEIKSITKKKNKYILTTSISEIEVFEEVLIEFRLLKATTLSSTDYNKMIEYSKYVDSLHLAIAYLSKPRTKLEVKKYLYDNSSYDESVIKKLIDMGLINDALYKDMYVDYQSRINLKGPNLIKKELEQKGIYDDFDYPNYDENINKLTEKYLLNNKNKSTRALNQGLYNYLLLKGYNPTFSAFTNDDSSLIEKEVEKLLRKYSCFNQTEKRKKIFQALIYKGFDASTINNYLDNLED